MTVRFFMYLVLLGFTFAYGIRHRKRLSMVQQRIALLVGIVFAFEVLGRLFSVFYGSSFPVYHFYLPTLLFVIVSVYANYFTGKVALRWLRTSAAVLAFGSVLISHFISHWKNFPSYQTLLISFFIVFVSFLVILEMLKKPSMLSLKKQVQFIFPWANIVFYAINIFIFGLFDPFKQNHLKIPHWEFHVLYLSNLFLYAACLYCLTLKSDERG